MSTGRDAGMSIAQIRRYMEIRFISSLTPDDENAFAPALMRAVAAVLDQFPIAYTLRVETTGAQVFQHSHPTFDATPPIGHRSEASLSAPNPA